MISLRLFFLSLSTLVAHSTAQGVITFKNETHIICVSDNTTLPIFIEPLKEPTDKISSTLIELGASWNDWSLINSSETFHVPIIDKRWQDFGIKNATEISMPFKNSFSIWVYEPAEFYVGAEYENYQPYYTLVESKNRWTLLNIYTRNGTTRFFKNCKEFLKVPIIPSKIKINMTETNYWKVENYKIRVAYNVSQVRTSISVPFTERSCLVLYVYLCEFCLLDIYIEDVKNLTLSGKNTMQDDLLRPQEIELSPIVNISLSRYTMNGSTEGYWAIDIRHCPATKLNYETYKRTPANASDRKDFKCKILEETKLETNDTKNYSYNIFHCKQHGTFGRNCNVNCSILFGMKEQYCESYKISFDGTEWYSALTFYEKVSKSEMPLYGIFIIIIMAIVIIAILYVYLTQKKAEKLNSEEKPLLLIKTMEEGLDDDQLDAEAQNQIQSRQHPEQKEPLDRKQLKQFLCGFYALKLSTDDDVDNFEMTSSSNDYESFDDIKIEVVFKNGRKRTFMFMIQCKENIPVSKKHFDAIHKAEDVVFILYTHNKANLENSKLKKDTVIEEYTGLEHRDLLFNTSKIENSVFEVKSKKSRKTLFYLFTQQYDVNGVETNLKKMLENVLKCDVFTTLAYFLNRCWTQQYVLTKSKFIAELTELALPQFIQPYSNEKSNDKTECLKQSLMKFEMTIVQSTDNDFIKEIWNRDEKPLIIKIDDDTKSTIQSILLLLKRNLGEQKIILLGTAKKEDFKDWDVFESLSDLKNKSEEIYSYVAKNFYVSFQGRSKMTLQELININNDLLDHVKSKHLFEMSQKCYIIGEKQKELPEQHIPRTVFFSESAKTAQENTIFENRENNLNVFCAPPGMGKSRMMHVLSNICPSDSWAFAVSLINYNRFLAKQSHSTPQMEEIFKKFLFLDTEDSLTKQIKEVLIRQKKIEVFLDGLDEVDSEHQNLMIYLAQYMTRKGLHVWMSSRENLREKLVQTLKTETIEINELSEEEQANYIRKKLKKQYDEYRIETIISAIFKSVHISNSQQLLGIPLQLHIITEILLHNKKASEEVENQNMFVLTRMYKLFFEGKQEIKHQKLRIETNVTEQLGISFDVQLEQYEIPALLSCLDPDDVKALKIDITKNNNFLNDIREKGDKNGIIKQVTEDRAAIFEHQTFAEYFACVWFKKNKRKVRLLGRNFFGRQYENLRRIFDIMMAEKSPLHLAVIYQDFEQIKKYLDTAELLQRDAGGRTLLHLLYTYSTSVSFFGGSYDKFKFLRRESDGKIIQIIDLLITKLKDKVGEKDGLFDFNCLEYLLYRGKVNPIMKFIDLWTLDDILDTLTLHGMKHSIFVAALTSLGCVELVKKVIKKNPKLTYSKLGAIYKHEHWDEESGEYKKDTYLLLLAIKGCSNDDYAIPRPENIRVVQLLLREIKNEQQNEHRNDFFCKPLDFACYNGCSDMLEILIKNGAKCSGGNTILHQAARWKKLNEPVLEIVRNCQINMNATNYKGQTALHFVLKNRLDDMAKRLLENNVDATIEDKMNNTALHYLTQSQEWSIEIAEMLISKEVDINSRNNKGETSVHYTCRSGSFENLQYLHRLKADFKACDNSGNTSLHFAAKRNTRSEQVLSFLLEQDLDLNACNDLGQTPLMVACQKGCFENVKILCERNAVLTVKDKNGKSVISNVQERRESYDKKHMLDYFKERDFK